MKLSSTYWQLGFSLEDDRYLEPLKKSRVSPSEEISPLDDIKGDLNLTALNESNDVYSFLFKKLYFDSEFSKPNVYKELEILSKKTNISRESAPENLAQTYSVQRYFMLKKVWVNNLRYLDLNAITYILKYLPHYQEKINELLDKQSRRKYKRELIERITKTTRNRLQEIFYNICNEADRYYKERDSIS